MFYFKIFLYGVGFWGLGGVDDVERVRESLHLGLKVLSILHFLHLKASYMSLIGKGSFNLV